MRVLPLQSLFLMISLWFLADLALLGLHWFDLSLQEVCEKAYWETLLALAVWAIDGRRMPA